MKIKIAAQIKRIKRKYTIGLDCCAIRVIQLISESCMKIYEEGFIWAHKYRTGRKR